MKIRKNDNVLVIKGKDRGKKGKIISVFPSAGTSGKVIVAGANMTKKHQRPKRSGEKGKIVSVEFPLNIANVALICPKCGALTRVRYKVIESGEKTRICKKCGEEI